MSLNIAKSNKKRVVIVGGGFGGLKLANKLKKWSQLPYPSPSVKYSSIGKISISVWRKYVPFSRKRI